MGCMGSVCVCLCFSCEECTSFADYFHIRCSVGNHSYMYVINVAVSAYMYVLEMLYTANEHLWGAYGL